MVAISLKMAIGRWRYLPGGRLPHVMLIARVCVEHMLGRVNGWFSQMATCLEQTCAIFPLAKVTGMRVAADDAVGGGLQN